CHYDELDTDGVGFSNGASAPTVYHQVKPNHNLSTTDAYFWNGSFSDGNYTSLAFAAQTRTNCELVDSGFIEGPGSNPFFRFGDPNNFITNGNDGVCQPIVAGPNSLPLNFDQITQQVAAEKQIRDQRIRQITGFDTQTLSRLIDLYSVAELRLPPNPLKQMYDQDALDDSMKAEIDRGKATFMGVGCAHCHDPADARHPFADGLNHGSGADWVNRFVTRYARDPRILFEVGGLPQTMLDAVSSSVNDHEVNVHVDPLDSFEPFCWTTNDCLV